MDDHVQLHWQNQNMLKCHEQNAFGNIIHQSRRCFPLRPNYDVFDLHRKTLKSYLDVTNQKKSCNKKEPAEFNGDGRSLLHAHHEQTHTEIEHQEIHKTENTHECTEYGKAFLKKSQLNEHKIILTQERNPMDVVCVGKPSSRSSSSLNISELTKERNPMSVVSVEEPSSGNFSLLNIRRCIREINPMYAVYVEKHSTESSS